MHIPIQLYVDGCTCLSENSIINIWFYAAFRSCMFNYRNKYGLYKHIFQVVWDSSTLLGVGRANIKQNGMSCSYFVARYKPAGNYRGNYKSNVFKGKFTKAICNGLKNGVPTSVFPGDGGSSDKVGVDTSDDANFLKEIRDSPRESFDQNALEAHNRLRALHGSTDMKIDSTLSAAAEMYARKLANLGTLKHSPQSERDGAGENLGYMCLSNQNFEVTGAEATKKW